MSAVEDVVSRQDRSKPDPDEPFRYTCPNCRKQVHRHVRGFTYRCQDCKEAFPFRELYDEKKDRVLASHTADSVPQHNL